MARFYAAVLLSVWLCSSLNSFHVYNRKTNCKLLLCNLLDCDVTDPSAHLELLCLYCVLVKYNRIQHSESQVSINRKRRMHRVG